MTRHCQITKLLSPAREVGSAIFMKASAVGAAQNFLRALRCISSRRAINGLAGSSCARAYGVRKKSFSSAFTARLKPCPDTCLVDRRRRRGRFLGHSQSDNEDFSSDHVRPLGTAGRCVGVVLRQCKFGSGKQSERVNVKSCVFLSAECAFPKERRLSLAGFF